MERLTRYLLRGSCRLTTYYARHTTDDDECQPLAVNNLSDSGDLIVQMFKSHVIMHFPN